MLARGSLGNPWLFQQVLGIREHPPTRAQVLDELDWTIDRAVRASRRLQRATRYLRKFYPWYVLRLGLEKAHAKQLGESLQQASTLEQARRLLADRRADPPWQALAGEGRSSGGAVAGGGAVSGGGALAGEGAAASVAV